MPEDLTSVPNSPLKAGREGDVIANAQMKKQRLMEERVFSPLEDLVHALLACMSSPSCPTSMSPL